MKFSKIIAALSLSILFTCSIVAANDCKTCYNTPYKTNSRACKTKVCSQIINRCSTTKTAKGVCGESYCYTVTTVTVRDQFSDGSVRVWSYTLD